MLTYVSWNLLVIGMAGAKVQLILVAPNILALVLNCWRSVAWIKINIYALKLLSVRCIYGPP